MSNLIEKLSEYIKENKDASLKGFFYKNLTLLQQHTFTSKEAIRSKMKERFIDFFKKYHPDCDMPSKTPVEIRTLIYKWFYALNEGTGEDIYEQNKQAIDQFLKSETSH
ncbi:hypothetical protein A0J61_11431, partial [Choanephora cucurbitarum]